MRPTISIDASRWQKAANDLLRESKKSMVDFVNGQAFRVITWAIKFTQKANRRAIEHLMQSQVVSETPRHGEAGARGWVNIERNIGRGTFAERLLVAYFRKHGKWPVQGATHEDRIRRLVAVKVKSVGMMKAGWINAANALRRVIYRLPASAASKQAFGSGKKLGGYAIPAKFSLRGKIEATVANEAPAYQRSKRKEKAWTGDLGDPMPVLIRGLQIALNRAQASMEKELARRLKSDLHRFGVR